MPVLRSVLRGLLIWGICASSARYLVPTSFIFFIIYMFLICLIFSSRRLFPFFYLIPLYHLFLSFMPFITSRT